jgi:glycerophosphoryl diester phosphodiesterase
VITSHSSYLPLWFFNFALLTCHAAAAHDPPTPPGKSEALQSLHRLDPKTPAGLKKLFQYTTEPLPIVSAHRGGAQKHFPENCIATFENTLRHTYAILEIDPRYTEDRAIVVHHDATLDRTTTGRGPLLQHSLAELKQLRLKDNEDHVTDYQIPTLDEVLEWARGKTVLVLDQKDVPVAARVKKIEEHHAESYAMLIVYNYADAKECYALNKQIMMEVMVPNQKQFAEFSKTGVPWSNVVAFVGHTLPEDKKLFEMIHEQGTSCMAGSSRNLDRELTSGRVSKIEELESGYRGMLQRGVDLIEADLASQVGQLLYKNCPIPASKAEMFRR